MSGDLEVERDANRQLKELLSQITEKEKTTEELYVMINIELPYKNE